MIPVPKTPELLDSAPRMSLLLVGGTATDCDVLAALTSSLRGDRRIVHLQSLEQIADGHPFDHTDLTVLFLDALPREARGTLDDHAALLGQTPLLLMGASSAHQQAIEGFRQGAGDWLVPGETDPVAVPGIIEQVIARFDDRGRLRRDKERYQAVVEDQFDLICRFLPDGTLTFVNSAYADYFGLSVHALEGTNFLERIPVSEQDRVLEQLTSLTPDLPATSFDHQEERHGETIWQQWTDSAVFDDDGTVLEYQSIGRDITSRRKAELDAIASESRYRAMDENSPVMMHTVDRFGRLLNINQTWSDTLGYREDEVIGKQSLEFLTENSKGVAKEAFERLMKNGFIRDQALQFRNRDGDVLDLLLTATVERNARGQIDRILSVGVEITDRVRALDALEKEKERLRITLASIGDAVITTDSAYRVDYLNPTAEELTGWLNTEACGLDLSDVFPPEEFSDNDTRTCAASAMRADCLSTLLPISGGADDSTSESRTLQLRHRHQDVVVTVDLTVAPIREADGRVFGLVLVFRDMTESRELTELMTYQANHDSLTGLVNRRAFESRLDRVVTSATTAPDVKHVLCFLDLDRFKLVNDTCGHAAGDKLLIEVSKLLQSLLRERDILARLGGDEFAILLEHCPEDIALDIANAAREAISNYRFMSGERVFRIGVSIGLVTIDGDSIDVDSVLKAADSACFAAKDAGRNRVHVFRNDDSSLLRQREDSDWVQRLNSALENDRFELFAQTIESADCRDNADRLHMELLLRMRAEDGSLIPPGAFIPTAERYQIMNKLDRWVVSNALDWLAERSTRFDALGSCSINLSCQSLTEPDFLAFIEDQFVRTAVPYEKICFEITETAAINNVDAARAFMDALRAHGCTFSLDDFGTGLSSFAYLRSLPVDHLKIDGLFVKSILDDSIDLAMVRTINKISQVLGKKTIAEYVESSQIRERLAEMGIDLVQGYGVSMPVPLNDLWDDHIGTIGDDHNDVRHTG